MARPSPKSLKARFSRVKLLLCDVDGVLTDASVFIGDGIEFKRFHIRDGLGIRMLAREGILTGWISNRPSAATTARARELKVDFLHQGSGSKVEAAEAILVETGLGWEAVCYIGDDVVDLGLIAAAGVGVAVADAIPSVVKAADYVTKAGGGQGAVREVIELILDARGRWKTVVRDHANGKPKDAIQQKR